MEGIGKSMTGYHWDGPSPSLDGYFYAVAIRDGEKLYLPFWVRRADRGDIYGFIPRETPIGELRRNHWSPHVSYHVDGQLHHKSFNHKSGLRRCQKLDANFQGEENLVVTDMTATGARAVNITFSTDRFTDVIELPITAVEQEPLFIALDVVEKGHSIPHAGEWITESRYSEPTPEIILSIWRISGAIIP